MEDPRRRLSDADKMVLERLCKVGNAWIVGGWVRDLLSGLEPKEVDYATSLKPRDVVKLFPRNIPIGEKYGTIMVLADVKPKKTDSKEDSWEVTTLRRDGSYGDGRRPENVEFGLDIENDLARRDFTINAMAIDGSSGELIDPFSGQEDLVNGILRAVGDADERISEDGLRILRAFRFLDSKNGTIRNLDENLSNAIRKNVVMLENVSEERKWNELAKIISSQNATHILLSMKEHGVLSEILPDVLISSIDGKYLSGEPSVRLALLCNNDLRSGSELASHLKSKLKLSNEEENTISFLHDIPKNAIKDKSNSTLRRFRACISREMQFKVACYFGSEGADYLKMTQELSEAKAGYSPIIDGDTLITITGLKPGPRLGRLKEWLHRKQIEEDLVSNEDVIGLLETINWKDEDPQSWRPLSWP